MKLSRAIWFAAALGLLALGCAPKKPANDGDATAKKGEKEASGQLSEEQLQERMRTALSEPDPVKRGEKLEKLVGYFPAGSPGYEFTAQALIQTWAVAGDLDKMEEAAQLIAIEDDMAGAELLNAMAYAYAEAGQQLSEAQDQVTRALNILDRMEKQNWRGVDPTDWLEEIERRRGYYLDTLAWIRVKQGKLKEAIAMLKGAVKRADLAAIRYHLAYALQESGDQDGAVQEYARAVALGGEDAAKAEEALAKFEDIDTEKVLEAARDAIKISKRESVLAKAVDEDVPTFSLTDREGNAIDESTLAGGGVTVIDFWASWCGPCKEEFPILQEVYEQYQDNPKVRFVAITVDQEYADAQKFLDAGEYTLPVAHEGSGEIAQKFGVRGLPTLLIIGPDGRIRFKHIGFDPELEDELPLQIDALLEDKVGPKKAEATP